MSSVSSADRQLFFGLANPECTRDEDDPNVEARTQTGVNDSNAWNEGDVEPVEDEGEEEYDERSEAAAGVDAHPDELSADDAYEPTADPAHMSPEDVVLEKQAAILELERLKAQGIELSRTFSMSDSLSCMQFEIRRHLLHIEQVNALSFMRDGMRLCFSGLEAANNAYGPLLELNGWAAHENARISNHAYDSVLSKLHAKYWRRGGSSPEMELAMAVLGSMGTFHFRQKMMARPSRAINLPDDDDSGDEDEDLPNDIGT